jgi:hypothetical protein
MALAQSLFIALAYRLELDMPGASSTATPALASANGKPPRSSHP